MAIANYNQPQSKSSPIQTRRVWYTGKTINATKGSRTVLTPTLTDAGTKADTLLQIGSVLVRDPYGFDNGYGVDYTQALTGFLHEHKVVVVGFSSGPASNDLVNDGYGQWVDVMESSDDVPVMVKDTGITLGASFLAPATGSFALSRAASTAATGIIDVASLASITNGVNSIMTSACAIPVDTGTLGNLSGTAAKLVRCRFGNLANVRTT